MTAICLSNLFAKRRRKARALVFAAAVAVAHVGTALAQPSTSRPGTMVIFPLVLNDGTHDTLVQITNNSNLQHRVRCFYKNGTTCAGTEFELRLTRQQPTGWVVSQGREVRRRDAATGLDPGVIPPVPPGFSGTLTCVQVDDSGVPLAANSLVGVATLQTVAGADVAKYDAVGLEADFNFLDFDDVLCLGSGAPGCSGAEFIGCADRLLVEQSIDGAEDPVAGADSAVRTEIAFAPCTADYVGGVPGESNILIIVRNEFEESLSASFSVECWERAALIDKQPVFSASLLGSERFHTQILPSDGGVVATVLTRRTGPTAQAVAFDAADLAATGDWGGGDKIVMPPLVP